jgi:hypothetical protein
MKKIIIILIMFVNLLIVHGANIPLIVDTEEDVFRKISKSINTDLPQKIDILIFDIMMLNISKDTSNRINKNFEIIMKSQQFIYKYSILFMKDVKTKDLTTDYTFVDNYNEQELLSYAKYIQKDAILLASITLLENETKKIWDKSSGKYIEKKIALLQGNIFNTENNQSMLRFSYYLLID